jgi:hypothetical protein
MPAMSKNAKIEKAKLSVEARKRLDEMVEKQSAEARERAEKDKAFWGERTGALYMSQDGDLFFRAGQAIAAGIDRGSDRDYTSAYYPSVRREPQKLNAERIIEERRRLGIPDRAGRIETISAEASIAGDLRLFTLVYTADYGAGRVGLRVEKPELLFEAIRLDVETYGELKRDLYRFVERALVGSFGPEARYYAERFAGWANRRREPRWEPPIRDYDIRPVAPELMQIMNKVLEPPAAPPPPPEPTPAIDLDETPAKKQPKTASPFTFIEL